jgi:hypothetical protein
MPATGFVIGTAQSVDTLTSTTWSNAANILVDSDTEATEAIVAKSTPGTGSTTGGWIKVTTFGFDSLLPADATITKVELQIRWRMNSTSGIGNRDICWAISGTRDTNTHSLTTEPVVLETTLMDVTAERAWTRNDLLNATFGVHARGRNGNNATDPSYRFAWIKVQVTYTTPVNASIAQPAGILKYIGASPTVTIGAAPVNASVTQPAGILKYIGATPTVVGQKQAAIAQPAGRLGVVGAAPSVVAVKQAAISPPAGSIAIVAPSQTILGQLQAAVVQPSTGLAIVAPVPSVGVTEDNPSVTVTPPAGVLQIAAASPTVVGIQQAEIAAPVGSMYYGAPVPIIEGVNNPVSADITQPAGVISIVAPEPFVGVGPNMFMPAGVILFVAPAPSVVGIQQADIVFSAGVLRMIAAVPSVVARDHAIVQGGGVEYTNHTTTSVERIDKTTPDVVSSSNITADVIGPENG